MSQSCGSFAPEERIVPDSYSALSRKTQAGTCDTIRLTGKKMLDCLGSGLWDSNVYDPSHIGCAPALSGSPPMQTSRLGCHSFHVWRLKAVLKAAI